jgi:hypothetical protein
MLSNGKMKLVNRNMEQPNYENKERNVMDANIRHHLPIDGIHP